MYQVHTLLRLRSSSCTLCFNTARLCAVSIHAKRGRGDIGEGYGQQAVLGVAGGTQCAPEIGAMMT